jgi:uncharacterized Zn-binding protein involved in type VI secretion
MNPTFMCSLLGISMSGEIIRLGDPTSHGGKVLEGSPTDICHGKPIAYMGHQTSCPKCKGTYPIIEGALTTTFYGKGVALAGMKTACGATLIATQFTDTVEYGQGAAARPAAQAKAALKSGATAAGIPAKSFAQNAIAPVLAAAKEAKFDLFFLVKNEKTGVLSVDTPYKITLEDGREFLGVTDAAGHTQKVFSDFAQKATIEVPYYDHSDTHAPSESDACGC